MVFVCYLELFAHEGISLTTPSEDSQRKTKTSVVIFSFSHYFPSHSSCLTILWWRNLWNVSEISIEGCCSYTACDLKRAEVQVTGHDANLIREMEGNGVEGPWCVLGLGSSHDL